MPFQAKRTTASDEKQRFAWKATAAQTEPRVTLRRASSVSGAGVDRYSGRRPSWPRKSIWSKNRCSDFSVSPSVT